LEQELSETEQNEARWHEQEGFSGIFRSTKLL